MGRRTRNDPLRLCTTVDRKRRQRTVEAAELESGMTSHNPKLVRKLEAERAERLAMRVTLTQVNAITKDTRLPGEIAGTYGVTAEVILTIQLKARASVR